MIGGGNTNDSATSRLRLVAFTQLVIPQTLWPTTLIIFDSKDKSRYKREAVMELPKPNIMAFFATQYDEADQFIEDIIALHRKPKQLTVVTSDKKILSTARSFQCQQQLAETWYKTQLRHINIAEQSWIAAGTIPTIPEASIDNASIDKASLSRDQEKRVRDTNHFKQQARRNLTQNEAEWFDDFEI